MTWTRQTIRHELHALLQQHVGTGAGIAESSHLVADLGIDSLGVMEILAEVEDRFSLKIPDSALRQVETVGDVTAYIEAKLQSEGRLQG
jgi:acyl carrier protein